MTRRVTFPRATVALCVIAGLGMTVGASVPHPATTVDTPHAATARGPTPRKIAAQAGAVDLCKVVSPVEFARVAGVAATQVSPGTADDLLTGLTDVYCIYIDGSARDQTIGRGTINYEVASDSRAALTIFRTVRESFTQVDTVRGVGDEAFAGTPAGAPGGTGLIVVQGRLLLYISVGGDQPTVERITEQLAGLVLSRVD